MNFELGHTETFGRIGRDFFARIIHDYAEEKLDWEGFLSESCESYTLRQKALRLLEAKAPEQQMGVYPDWQQGIQFKSEEFHTPIPNPTTNNPYRSLLIHFKTEENKRISSLLKGSLTAIYLKSIKPDLNYQDLKSEVYSLQSHLEPFKDEKVVQQVLSELECFSKLITKAERAFRTSKRRYINAEKRHSSLLSFYSLDVHTALCPLS